MSSENLDAVTLMLEHKADILHKNREGRNPLHLAARNQHLGYMKLLLELDLTGCGRVEADSEGTTVIHSPVESSSHEMVIVADALTPKQCLAKTEDQETGLHLAVNRLKISDMDWFIQKGALNEKDVRGNTPQHCVFLADENVDRRLDAFDC
jgi:ankyrin repeat protein